MWMAFEKSNQKMCKLMAKVGCIFCWFFLWISHIGDDVMMDDVMIAMWHADQQIRIIWLCARKTQGPVMNEMENFAHSDDELLVIQDGRIMHLRNLLISFRKYRGRRLFTNSFHELNFLAEALKNVLSWRISMSWATVGRGTGTKQLFCFFQSPVLGAGGGEKA